MKIAPISETFLDKNIKKLQKHHLSTDDKNNIGTIILLIATTKATKLKKGQNLQISGRPDSLIIIKVFFLKVKNKKNIKDKRKKNNLKKSICQTLASSNDLIMKPPQLRQKPPNKSKIYPGTLYKNCI